MAALPPIADQSTWEIALAQLRTREKAAARELDASRRPGGASHGGAARRHPGGH